MGTKPRRIQRAQREIVAILVLIVAVAGSIAGLIDPRLYDLHAPIAYWRDGLSHALIVKTIVDLGWFPVHTPWIGAPFGVDLLDYPFSDSLNFLLLRFFASLGGDWVVVQKQFYLFGYFANAGVAYVVMRKLGSDAALAIAGALMFTLLPYHWERPWHLLLGSYGVVALGVWLAYVAWQGTLNTTRRDYVAPITIALVVGCGGAYYAFFTSYLVLMAGLCRAIAARSLRALAPALVMVAGTSAAVALNVAPSIVYRFTHGPNAEIAVRSASDSEAYGLRLSQLVMPNLDHRIPAWSDFARRYAGTTPLVNENVSASIGVMGVIGLGFLAFVLTRRLGSGTGVPPARDDVLGFLVLIAFASFLLGTIGGLGSLFALTVSPLIRGYNRISVFIGFAAFTATILVIQQWISRLPRATRNVVTILAATAIGTAGALDLTPSEYPLPPPGVGDFASDRAFVQAAERKLPVGTQVWQLPFQPFPEDRSSESLLEPYGQLRGYLNSSDLHWSFGAVRGRKGADWARALSLHPIAEQVELAGRSGFGAVYLDRRGYEDHGKRIERELAASLGAPIAQSGDANLVMYRIPHPGRSPVPLDDLLPPVDAPMLFSVAPLTPLIARVEGMSGYEPWGRWTDGPRLVLELSRDLPKSFTLQLTTVMAMPSSADVPLGVRIGDVEETFSVPKGPSTVEIPFALDAATRRIEFTIPDPRSPLELGINNDGRKLGIGIASLTIVPAPTAR